VEVLELPPLAVGLVLLIFSHFEALPPFLVEVLELPPLAVGLVLPPVGNPSIFEALPPILVEVLELLPLAVGLVLRILLIFGGS